MVERSLYLISFDAAFGFISVQSELREEAAMALNRGVFSFCGEVASIMGLAVMVSMLTPQVARAQQYLMMPDSSAANRMVLFDPNDGSLINSNYFPLNGGTPIHAMQVGGEIWVSEQAGDRVARYDLVGNFLGQIGGGAGGGMDNIRGMGLVGDTVYVTNGGTANGAPSANSVVMFDTSGNPLGSFSTAGMAPSPFSVLHHQGDLLVGSVSGNNDIHRFDLVGGSIGVFNNSTLSFIEQLDHAINGDVLAAVFTTGVIARLDPDTGAQISTFPASGARGVRQLGNGNIMWTSSGGVFVRDVVAGISTNVYATSGGRYIDLLTIGGTPCLRGDVNGDTIVSNDDVTGFVTVILDPGAATPAQICAADINQDDIVDGRDAVDFTACVISGGCP